MNFEAFSEGHSIIHRLDPRFKISTAAVLTVTAAVLNNFSSLIPILSFAVFTILLANLKYSQVLYRLLLSNIMIFAIWIFVPFSTAGEPLLEIFNMTISKQGIEKAALISLKCNTILVLTISLISTIPSVVICRALYTMGINRKLTYILFFFIRYLEVIYLELRRLSDSMKIRGFRPSTNIHTYKTYANLVGMLLVRSWERSDRIYTAMICRGFNGNLYSMHIFKSERKDFLFLCSALVTVTVSIVLNRLS